MRKRECLSGSVRDERERVCKSIRERESVRMFQTERERDERERVRI